MKITIQTILDTVMDSMGATDITASQIIRWIAEAEAAVVNDVISHYEEYREEDYPINYDGNTDRATELIAPLPYSRLYEYYVKAQINYQRDELERYQNDLVQYKGAMDDFWCYYNERHKPIMPKFEVM